jgi:hypothetical protein
MFKFNELKTRAPTQHPTLPGKKVKSLESESINLVDSVESDSIIPLRTGRRRAPQTPTPPHPMALVQERTNIEEAIHCYCFFWTSL